MLIPLFASIAPFLVWPIELIFPYPHVVEELAKGFLVYFILESSGNKNKVILTVLAGVFFAFSESVMYMSNMFLVGTLWTPIQRLLLTIPLHTITMLIILLSGIKKKAFLPLGLIAAMTLHYFFNLFVGNL
ncbi:MAG: PrsW family glutamic-type intramembrane protease [Candidatus Levybacteria bacterium]|nr:PrsW family glutamic-type intramembrane protease [Candidatus Levybacteria bacterium]